MGQFRVALRTTMVRVCVQSMLNANVSSFLWSSFSDACETPFIILTIIEDVHLMRNVSFDR
jgi:hypothetical protein